MNNLNRRMAVFNIRIAQIKYDAVQKLNALQDEINEPVKKEADTSVFVRGWVSRNNGVGLQQAGYGQAVAQLGLGIQPAQASGLSGQTGGLGNVLSGILRA